MNPKKIIIRESERVLDSLLTAYTRNVGRCPKYTLQKVRLIIQLKSNPTLSNRKLSALLGISSATIQYWKLKYLKACDYRIEKPVKGPLQILIMDQRPEGRKKRKIITLSIEKKFKDYLKSEQGKRFSYKQLHEALTDKLNVNIKFETFRKYVKRDADYNNYIKKAKERKVKSPKTTAQNRVEKKKSIARTNVLLNKMIDDFNTKGKFKLIYKILKNHSNLWIAIRDKAANNDSAPTLVMVICEHIKDGNVHLSTNPKINALRKLFPSEFETIRQEYNDLKKKYAVAAIKSKQLINAKQKSDIEIKEILSDYFVEGEVKKPDSLFKGLKKTYPNLYHQVLVDVKKKQNKI